MSPFDNELENALCRVYGWLTINVSRFAPEGAEPLTVQEYIDHVFANTASVTDDAAQNTLRRGQIMVLFIARQGGSTGEIVAAGFRQYGGGKHSVLHTFGVKDGFARQGIGTTCLKWFVAGLPGQCNDGGTVRFGTSLGNEVMLNFARRYNPEESEPFSGAQESDKHVVMAMNVATLRERLNLGEARHATEAGWAQTFDDLYFQALYIGRCGCWIAEDQDSGEAPIVDTSNLEPAD